MTKNPWKGVAVAALAIAFACLVVCGVFILDSRSDEKAENRRLEEAAQDATDVNYMSCLRGNELRELMILQTELAYSAGSALDFTAVPSFASLPAETRQFFTDLADISRVAREAAATNPAHPKNSILTEIRKQLRDCEAEWPAHTPGLVLPHQKEPGT